MRDLVVLAADKSMKLAVEALIARSRDLQIRTISAEVYPHPKNDPGAYGQCDAFLRQFLRQFKYAMVMFDKTGSGQEARTREDIERDVEARLTTNGWADRAEAIVIDPELEAWVWSDSTHVDAALGWNNCAVRVRRWIVERGFAQGDEKPPHPKEAMIAALREVRMQFSSAIHQKLAAGVQFRNCSDPAFTKFIGALRRWFPA